jgi:hypothetical protein
MVIQVSNQVRISQDDVDWSNDPVYVELGRSTYDIET